MDPAPENEPVPVAAAPEMESAPDTAVAEMESAPETAVAEMEPEMGPAPETAVAENEVPAAVAPASQMSPVDVPRSPKQAALKSMQPPAPASPIDLTDDSEVNTAALVGRGAQAKHNVDAALLGLARAIRRPRAYVGYSAFVLMGLLTKCQPCVWEGSACLNLLEWAAPWATQHCTQEPLMEAIACALVAKAGGSVECVQISGEHPLEETSHFVAGTRIPALETAVAETAPGIEAFYAALGVATVPSICDGDCAVDVMTMMLGLPQTFGARKQLRIEISDYLISRISEPWMHDAMVVLQELELEDVRAYRSGVAQIVTAPIAAPIAAPVAVAAAVEQSATDEDIGKPDEESFAAMRWASKLDDDANVLSLLRSLPKQIVEEQVQLYRKRDETAVAARSTYAAEKIKLNENSRYHVRMLVAQRFHAFCHKHGIVADKRMPYGAMKAFRQEHIAWTGSLNKVLQGVQTRKWHQVWRSSTSNVLAAVAGEEGARPGGSEKSMLRSRARKTQAERKRAW